MRVSQWAVWLFGAVLLGCASAPPPHPAARSPEEEETLPPEEPPAPPEVVNVGAPEQTAPPSTASYEDATAKPENLDVHDDRVHLTDGQLTGPMRNVTANCRIPSNAKLTIKTAVQNGRAIGVTVNVRFERPKSKKPPPRSVLKYEAKTSTKIVACVDKAVRALSWPPSSRRDSFTTEF